jgi:hypothetical protein
MCRHEKPGLRMSEQEGYGGILKEYPNTLHMKSPNRDLLVLVKDEFMTEKAIELEVARLNKILYTVESHEHISTASEVIDLNRYRITRNQRAILALMREKSVKPFLFLNNLN